MCVGLFAWVDRRLPGAARRPTPSPDGGHGTATRSTPLVGDDPLEPAPARQVPLAHRRAHARCSTGSNANGEYVLDRTLLAAVHEARAHGPAASAFVGCVQGRVLRVGQRRGDRAAALRRLAHHERARRAQRAAVPAGRLARRVRCSSPSRRCCRCIRLVKVGENSIDYSLQNTARQALFLVSSRVEKYVGKTTVDTLFVRLGDVLSACVVAGGTLGPRRRARSRPQRGARLGVGRRSSSPSAARTPGAPARAKSSSPPSRCRCEACVVAPPPLGRALDGARLGGALVGAGGRPRADRCVGRRRRSARCPTTRGAPRPRHGRGRLLWVPRVIFSPVYFMTRVPDPPSARRRSSRGRAREHPRVALQLLRLRAGSQGGRRAARLRRLRLQPERRHLRVLGRRVLQGQRPARSTPRPSGRRLAGGLARGAHPPSTSSDSLTLRSGRHAARTTSTTASGRARSSRPRAATAKISSTARRPSTFPLWRVEPRSRPRVGRPHATFCDGHYGSDPTVIHQVAAGVFPLPPGFASGYTRGEQRRAGRARLAAPVSRAEGSGVRLEARAQQGNDVSPVARLGLDRGTPPGPAVLDVDGHRRVAQPVGRGGRSSDPLGPGAVPFTELVTLGGRHTLRCPASFPGASSTAARRWPPSATAGPSGRFSTGRCKARSATSSASTSRTSTRAPPLLGGARHRERHVARQRHPLLDRLRDRDVRPRRPDRLVSPRLRHEPLLKERRAIVRPLAPLPLLPRAAVVAVWPPAPPRRAALRPARPLAVDTDLRPVSLPCRPHPARRTRPRDLRARRLRLARSSGTAPTTWSSARSRSCGRSRRRDEAVEREQPRRGRRLGVVHEPARRPPDGRRRAAARSVHPSQLLLDTTSVPDGSWVIDKGKPNGSSPGFRVKIPGKGKYLFKADDPTARAPERGGRHRRRRVLRGRLQHLVRAGRLRQAVGLQADAGPHARRTTASACARSTRRRSTRCWRRRPARGSCLRFQASAWLAGSLSVRSATRGRAATTRTTSSRTKSGASCAAARVLAAWLDHFDAREQNSMDAWMADRKDQPDSSPGHVVHYYLDTSDCLGSEWDWEVISRRLGHSYVVDWGDIGARLLHARHPDPAVGHRGPGAGPGDLRLLRRRRTSTPDEWKNEYPNPAFSRMTERDGAWMARILSRFTPGAGRGRSRRRGSSATRATRRTWPRCSRGGSRRSSSGT